MQSEQIILYPFQNPFIFIKIGIIILIFFYVVFSYVIFKRIRIMNNVVEQSQSSFILVLISLINIIFAILLFLTAIVIL